MGALKQDYDSEEETLSARKKADQRWGMSPAELEAGVSMTDGNRSSMVNGESQLADKKSIPFDSEQDAPKSTSLKGRLLNHKKAIGGFGGVGLISLFIAGAGFVQGPFQLLQFSKLLQGAHFSNQENFGNDRTSRLTTLYRYAKTGTVQGTRLGAVGQKAAGRAEARLIKDTGLRPIYDPLNGRMGGFEILDETKAKKTVGELTKDQRVLVRSGGFSEFTGVNGEGDPTRGRLLTFDTADLSNRQVDALKRGAVSTVIDATDLRNISSAVSSRLLKKLGGIGVRFHPWDNFVRRTGEAPLAYRQRVKEARTETIKNGDVSLTERDLTRQTDADGNPVDNNADFDVDEAVSVGNESREISKNAVADGASINGTRNSKLISAGKKILSKLKGPAAVVGVVCAVKDLGNLSEDIQKAQVLYPMMRIGVRWMSIGSQIVSFSDINLEEMAVDIDDLYDEETGLGVVAAATIQNSNDQPVTGPDLDPAVRPSGVNGKPALFETIDSIRGADQICGVDNFISGIPVVGTVLGAPDAFINAVLSGVGLPTPEDLFTSLATLLSGESLNLNPIGPELGNIASYGARLASTEQSLGMGGSELSEPEATQLKAYNQELKKQEFAELPFYARLLDLTSTDSLASITLRNTPTKPENIARSFIGSVVAAVNPLELVSDYAGGAASAQDRDLSYDYGFPEFGFSLEEQQNPNIQDPYENAQYVETNIDRLGEEYGKCYPITITASLDIQIDGSEEAVSQFTQPEGCSAPLNAVDSLRYRMYLFDSVTAHSLNCYEGEGSSCDQIGFNAPIVQSGGTNNAVSGGTGEEIPLNGYKIEGIQVDSEADSCTGDLRSGSKIIADYVKQRWGKSYGGYDCRTKSTGPSLSIHSEGRAIDQSYDAFNPTELQEANETFGWLLANAQSIGVQYVKFWKLQWSPTNGLRCVTSPSDSEDHNNHIHYEVNRIAAAEQTPWYTTPTDFTPFTINQDLCPTP
jgi:hypothetical protein